MKPKFNLFINTIDGAQPSFICFNSNGVILYSGEFIDKQEHLVKKLRYFLSKRNLELNSIGKLFVLKGNGSFTAVRAGVVLANAISFLAGIPVKMADSSGAIKNFVGCKKRLRARAFYSGEPNITL